MSDIAQPTNPQPLDEGSIYAAVKAYVLAHALPRMDADHIYQGWQNRAALPAKDNDYAVISILSGTQNGTHVSGFDVDDNNDGILSVGGLIEVQVQIDFCSDTDAARARAQRLAMITRTPLAVQFFQRYGITARYAEDVRDLSFIGDAMQYVRRYMTTLRLSYWTGETVTFDYFTAVEPRTENVDAHHPPKR